MKKFLVVLSLSLFSIPTFASWRKVGDLNNDSKIDKDDLTMLVNIVLGLSDKPLDITFYDLNKDKKIDIVDVTLLVSVIKGEIEATEIFVPETVPIGGEKGSFD